MKIALDWIADYLDAPLDPAAAEQALTNAGLPLESNEPVGSTHVLDVEVTSNRSDCLSHIGLARELSALLGRTFRLPDATVRAAGPDVSTLTAVAVEDPAGCPYYSARLIQGVKVGPSPDWLVRRLESIGLRAVNNIVDVTNYVLMELGQPLHAFDFDTLTGKRIVVRRAKPGEKIVSIDGKTNTLDPAMLVIADERNPVAVAGVMGGKDTEVTDRTTNVLLESARFDPVTIRAQARALALMSDSSYRFERGIDPQMAELASRRAAALIQQLAGGTIAQGVIAVGSAAPRHPQVTLRLSRLKAVLGYDIPADRVLTILTALGFAPARDGDLVRCTVPSHRLDVEREIDLVEEAARVYGYAHIPTLDRVIHSVQPEPPEEKAGRLIRNTLVASGFSETITVTFVDEAEAKLFLPAAEGAPIRVSDAVRRASNVLRPSLLPSLLAVRRTNQNVGIPDARLFEHAEAFWQNGDASAKPPTQYRFLALVGNSVGEVRAALDIVIASLTPSARIEARPKNIPWFAPGVSAELYLVNGSKEFYIGALGQFSPDVQKQYDLRNTVAGAEVLWDALVEAFQPVRRAKPLPRFPGVQRDLSVVVDEAVRWADIHQAIAAANLPFLEETNFVTTFRSKQIGSDKKSLTLTLAFRDPAATLRSEQVDAQVKTAMDLLKEKFQANLRA